MGQSGVAQAARFFVKLFFFFFACSSLIPQVTPACTMDGIGSESGSAAKSQRGKNKTEADALLLVKALLVSDPLYCTIYPLELPQQPVEKSDTNSVGKPASRKRAAYIGELILRLTLRGANWSGVLWTAEAEKCLQRCRWQLYLREILFQTKLIPYSTNLFRLMRTKMSP